MYVQIKMETGSGTILLLNLLKRVKGSSMPLWHHTHWLLISHVSAKQQWQSNPDHTVRKTYLTALCGFGKFSPYQHTYPSVLETL